MSYIGQFIAFLVFCIVFVGTRHKLPLCGKMWSSQNKAQNSRKQLFFNQYVKLGRYCQKLFCAANESHIAILSFFKKHYCRKLTKKLSFRSKKRPSQSEAKNYPERNFFFSCEWEMGQILTAPSIGSAAPNFSSGIYILFPASQGVRNIWVVVLMRWILEQISLMTTPQILKSTQNNFFITTM